MACNILYNMLLYVAMSRAKSLHGLHFHEVRNPHKDESDKKIPAFDPITVVNYCMMVDVRVWVFMYTFCLNRREGNKSEH